MSSGKPVPRARPKRLRALGEPTNPEAISSVPRSVGSGCAQKSTHFTMDNRAHGPGVGGPSRPLDSYRTTTR